MLRQLTIFILILFSVIASSQRFVVVEKSSTDHNGKIEQCPPTDSLRGIEVEGNREAIDIIRRRRHYQIKPLDPKGMKYIWTNLSPNGRMILFTMPRQGTFVCNLRGKILYKLGTLDAATWYDNRHVVGMRDSDNGNEITKSEVYIINLKRGVATQLSETDEVAIYPCSDKPYIYYYTQQEKQQIKIKPTKR